MMDEIKPVIAHPPVDVYFELQNINSSQRRANPGGFALKRREVVSNYFRFASKKPDFLALVDGVSWKAKSRILIALHDRWPEAKYEHVAYRWNGHEFVFVDSPRAYKLNQEALIYDSAIWEYIHDPQFELYEKDFKEKQLAEGLANRYRAGLFRHKATSQQVYVVSFHGRKNKPYWLGGQSEETRFRQFKGSQFNREVLILEFVTTLLEKVPKSDKIDEATAVFLCGDFNLCMEKKDCVEFLKKHGFEIFPNLSKRLPPKRETSSGPLDYILFREPGASVMDCHEYDVLQMPVTQTLTASQHHRFEISTLEPATLSELLLTTECPKVCHKYMDFSHVEKLKLEIETQILIEGKFPTISTLSI